MLKVNETILPDKNKLFDYFNQIYVNGQVTNNSVFVNKLEETISSYTKANFTIATSSGTAALHLAIKSLEKEEGEIITTPLSFIASASPILWEKYKPVFCDVDENTFCLDVDQIEQKINSKTVAIIAVNLFGNTCDITNLEKLTRKHNLTLIFDSAHCFGTSYKGKSCLQYGDISITSFHSSKIFSTAEGGAIFVNDKGKFDKFFKLRYFGKDKNNQEVILGTNAKMSEFHAAYGLASFEGLTTELEKRKEISEYYKSFFEQNKELYLLQKIQEHTIPNNSYFPLVLLKPEIDIEKLVKEAYQSGILFRRYFYPLLNELSFFHSVVNDTPIAKSISKRIICLPIHSNLKSEDLLKIVNFLDLYFKNE